MIILDAMFKTKNTADGNSQDFWFVYNNKFLRTGNWKQKSALFPKFFSCLASQIIHIRKQANITLIHGGRKVHIDDLQRKHNFKIIRYFFNTSKCATNHVISLSMRTPLELFSNKLWMIYSSPIIVITDISN